MPSSTVLYVEDEEFDVFFMRRAFGRAGLEGSSLMVVSDGQEAINYLAGRGRYADRHQFPVPALVLLDLNLPLVSGFQTLEWVRKQPELRNLPVIVFSSSARTEDRQRAQDLGASDYIEKPTSGLQFAGVLQGLRSKWLGSGVASANGAPTPSGSPARARG
jgi:CheY-like chemotaxis protein